jgi:hypothetical protein
VEESVGGRVSRQKASVDNPGTELAETVARCAPGLGDHGCRLFKTFETWLLFENFDNADWIRRQWVERFLKKCASEVQDARKKGR